MKKVDNQNYHIIWNHEAFQAEMIAHDLVSPNGDISGSFFRLFITSLFNWFRHGKRVRVIRENLLYTNRLAFEAAKKIHQGTDRKEALGAVEYESKKDLAHDRTWFDSEDVRVLQMVEIETLMDHYLRLFQSKEEQYMTIIKMIYRTRSEYESFIKELEKAEDEVIRAAVSSMEKENQSERVAFFNNVKKFTSEFRMNEVHSIFPEESQGEGH